MIKLAIIMLAGALLTGCNQSNTYNKDVTVVITTHDTVMFEDEMGYLWTMDNDHKHAEGDICTLTMSDNGTPDNIFDDIILPEED